MKIFVSIAPGLEFVLAEELRLMLSRPIEQLEGGCELEGDLVDAAGICLWSRSAGRVRVRVGTVRASSLQQLHGEARRLDWRPFTVPGQPLEIKVTATRSRLGRTDVIGKKVGLAVKDALRGPGHRGRPPRTPLELHVRVDGKLATLSVDAGGLLHKRGWRLATAKAPMRENLATACLFAAGWQPGVPLVDPMCGSGTFAIEAACWTRDIAPGLGRRPAVVDLPGFPAGSWDEMLAEAREPGGQGGRFWAADRDAGAIKATRTNAERAGVLQDLTLEQKDVSQAWQHPPEGIGLVAINAPYGRRVAERVALAGLYRRMGKALKAQLPGWRLLAICPDKSLAGHLARDLEELTRFSNGGIPVSAWVGRI
jgi:putative N6-adenine-specific DNA methylase